MHIGFTGTQIGMSDSQRKAIHGALLGLFQTGSVFHHGDCIGADAEAHNIAVALGYRIIIHPPLNESKRAFCKGADMTVPALPYLERNKIIVNATTSLVAAPKGPEELRSGTWSTVRYAKRIGRPVTIFMP